MSSVSPRDHEPVRVLFVCLGNICRSPTAEAVLRQYVKEAGLSARIIADSAGTGDYHIGEPPDMRACSAASRRGYDLSPLRARQVGLADFRDFDYVLAMDDENLRGLKRMCPPEYAHKLRLFTDHCTTGARAVPDPYAGGPQGFELVLDLVEDCAGGLLNDIKARFHASR
ncbi:MAG: low molecular weight protein-tyrosine-phosphatase [Burkholderiales bacterium]